MKSNPIVHRLGLFFGGLLAAAFVLNTGIAGAVDYPQYADAKGGVGGAKYTLGCGGDVVVGFGLNQGDAVNRLELLCAALHKGPAIDAAFYEKKVYVGGNGGDPTSVKCPANSVVVGLRIASPGNDVNNINLVCLNIVTGLKSEVEHPYETEAELGVVFESTVCPDFYIGTGAFGTADSVVHSVGLKCEKNPFAPKQFKDPELADTQGNWSAFAANKKGGWGFAVFQDSEQHASKLALNGCGGSGNGCNVFWTTQDTCVAYADSNDPHYNFAAGGGTTEDQAKKNALKFCQSGDATSGSCIIQKSACH